MFYPCPHCQKAFSTLPAAAGHVGRVHKKALGPTGKLATEKLPEGYTLVGFQQPSPPTEAPSGASAPAPSGASAPAPSGASAGGPPSQTSTWPYKTQPDYMAILEDVTKTLPEGARQEVMEFAQLQGGMQPADLQQLLQKLDGVSKDQAYIIAQKYQLAMWKALQQAVPEGFRFALPSMGGPQGQTPWQGFVPSTTGGYPSPYPYAPTPYPWVPQPSQGAAEQNPQLATLEEKLSGMVGSLSDQMGVLQQRLDQQEAERLRAEEDRKRKEETDRLVNEHREELQRMEERHTAALKALEDKLAPQQAPGQDTEVATLRKEIADLAKSLHDQEMTGLRQEIAELRKREPTSPTELGVIQHTADKVVEAAKDAGEGLQTLVMGMQKGAAFPAGRRSPQERAALGEELVKRADKNTALVGEMDKFFAGGG